MSDPSIEPAPQPPRQMPDISPGTVLEIMALFVSTLPDRIAEWPSSRLYEMHQMGLQVASAAADALSAKDRPVSP